MARCLIVFGQFTSKVFKCQHIRFEFMFGDSSLIMTWWQLQPKEEEEEVPDRYLFFVDAVHRIHVQAGGGLVGDARQSPY